MKILWHVSFEPIKQFELRVPAHTIKGEDNKTPRICMTESVESCINAMPAGGYALKGLMSLPKSERIIFAYTCLDEYKLIEPNELVEKYGVLDAKATTEHWLLEIPKLKEVAFKVYDAKWHKQTDSFGNKGIVIDYLDYDVTKNPTSARKDRLKQMLPDIFKQYDWRAVLAAVGEI